MIRILKFLAINIIGFFSISALFLLADTAGYIPTLPDNLQNSFQYYFFGGGMWAWVLGALLSVGYLLMNKSYRLVFYFMPLVLPLLTGFGVLVFFN